MAVQAQYPSNTLLQDFRNRVRFIENRNLTPTAAPVSLEGFQSQPAASNLFRVYNTVAGMNFLQQSVFNGGTVLSETENEHPCNNIPGSRKRSRDCEDALNRLHAFIPSMDYEHNSSNSPSLISPISTGLRLAFDDNRLNSPAPSTSGRGNAGSSIMSILTEEMQSHMFKQREEIEQLIKIQGERMKQALEEKRRRHARALVAALEEGVTKRLKLKDEEIEKASRRSMELEERVKQLSLEAQLWQNLAKNSELMASNLRNSLEQVVAQSREQSREGCGESEVDDAESCHYGEAGDAQARTFKENKELKEQRTCRVCRTNNVCILLLPCRHLCLCKDCEGRLDECPLCRTTKNASVQVYMS